MCRCAAILLRNTWYVNVHRHLLLLVFIFNIVGVSSMLRSRR
jgi:hypothetical protein